MKKIIGYLRLIFYCLFYLNAHAQFSHPGQLDTTFNFGRPHSFFTDPMNVFFGDEAVGAVRSIALQPDGKALIGGEFVWYNGISRLRIARINVNGTLDTSFRPGSGLSGGSYPSANSLVIQPDGKVLIGGSFNTYNGISRNHITRINTNGSLDNTFNPGVGVSGDVRTISLQPDGKVLIGGFFIRYNGITRNGIARLNANGSLDTSFNPGTGVGSLSFPGVTSLALQPDGKVLIVGDFTSYNGTPRNRIARLNANGSLDTSFNPGTGGNNTVTAVVLQPDGKILIGGSFTTFNGASRNRIARLNANGSLDTTFNPGTGAAGGSNAAGLSLTRQPDGRILIGGVFTTYNGIARNRIARLNTNGSLDTSFNPGTGVNKDDFPAVYSIVLQPDGKVLIGGTFTTYNGISLKNIARINTNGNQDSKFNPITGVYGAHNLGVNTFALQPDGKILIAGSFRSYNDTFSNCIARLNTNGTLDTTFNTGVGLQTGSHDVRSIALQSNGKVLIGGRFDAFNGIPRYNILRLNADGSLDTTFNPSNGANNDVESIVLQPDGKVLIGGSFDSYNNIPRKRIARLNPDGSLDNTFNTSNGANLNVNAIALQPDGKVLIGGWFTSFNNTARNRIARLNVNGTLDTTFNPGIGANGDVWSIVPQPDGKILIGGTFTNYHITIRNNIARLNADGSLDNTFNPSTGANGIINDIALQPDGKVLIGGGFTIYNNTGRNRIARLNADGSLDNTFNPGNGADSTVFSLALQPDGKVLIGGCFTSYNGIIRSRIARLIGVFCAPVANTTSDVAICQGQSKSLSGTPGGTWSIVSGPGTITGSTYNATGAPGTVSIVNNVGVCPSPPVSFTVHPIANAPTVSPLSLCSNGITIITPTAGGANYRFYTDSIGGSPLTGGNGVSSFTTPVLSNNTTYYVASVSAAGCESNTRTAVTVTVNPIPTTPTVSAPAAICAGNTSTITPTAGGANYRFYADSTGGSPLTGGNGVASFTTPVLSNNTTYYVASVSAAGCESNTRTAVTMTVNPIPTTPTVSAPAAICAGNTSTITPTAGGANYRFYADSTGSSPLTGGNGVASFTTPVLSNNTTFCVTSVSAAGCESNTRTAVTVTVNPLPAAPTVSAPAAICEGNTSSITPTAGGANYRFYADSTGGSPLTGGNGVASFTTPTLMTTTNYHVASVSAAGCESSTRTAVTVTVNPLPTTPIVSAPAAICAGNTSTITPTAGGANYRFFADSTGSSPLTGGNGVASFTTPVLSNNTTFYVASVSAAGCESNSRTAVTVTINPLPAAPTVSAPAAICEGNTSTITPTAGGANYHFYADSTGGSPLTGGNGVASFTTPVLSNTTTYHVASISAAGCESSTRTSATVTVNPLPIVNIVQVGDSLTSTALPGSYQWLLNGVVVSGATSVTFKPSQSGIYTLRVTSPQGCVGISNAINYSVTSLANAVQGPSSNWSVYPVPFNNELKIKAQAPFEYEIINILGVVLLSGSSETTETSIIIKDMAAGIYMVRITINGYSQARMVVKE